MFLKAALGLLLVALSATFALAHEFKIGDLVIGHPWSRATPGGAKVGGGYFTVTNNGTSADKLLSATTEAAGKTEIHEMSTKDGVMTMRPIAAGLTIEPGKTLTLAPGGYHLMMTDLKAPLKEGDRVKATLVFERAGKVEVTINVEGMGAQHQPAEHKHDMPGHKM